MYSEHLASRHSRTWSLTVYHIVQSHWSPSPTPSTPNVEHDYIREASRSSSCSSLSRAHHIHETRRRSNKAEQGKCFTLTQSLQIYSSNARTQHPRQLLDNDLHQRTVVSSKHGLRILPSSQPHLAPRTPRPAPLLQANRYRHVQS